MAIFVEGQTERIFLEKLIRELAGNRNVHIDAIQGFGGSTKFNREWKEIHAHRPEPATEYYVLLHESANGDRVLSDIRDQYQTLVNQGFRRIIGVRDVYPEPAADLPVIRADFQAFVPAGPVVPVLILCVMEVEAWFVAEHTHFQRMHPSLTPAVVSAGRGYDPATHDVTQIPHPSADLRLIYQTADLAYNKSRRHAERTVNELSYEETYLNVAPRVGDLNNLISQLDTFLIA
jgi:hypothetical protein